MGFNWVEVVGFIAAVCTATAYMPQVLMIWRTKDGSGISWGMITLLLVALTLWLVYGFAISKRPVIFVNGISLLLTITMAVLKVRYSAAKRAAGNA